jgi:hypothetical protein
MIIAIAEPEVAIRYCKLRYIFLQIRGFAKTWCVENVITATCFYIIHHQCCAEINAEPEGLLHEITICEQIGLQTVAD